jgi:hypothetical protein
MTFIPINDRVAGITSKTLASFRGTHTNYSAVDMPDEFAYVSDMDCDDEKLKLRAGYVKTDSGQTATVGSLFGVELGGLKLLASVVNGSLSLRPLSDVVSLIMFLSMMMWADVSAGATLYVFPSNKPLNYKELNTNFALLNDDSSSATNWLFPRTNGLEYVLSRTDTWDQASTDGIDATNRMSFIESLTDGWETVSEWWIGSSNQWDSMTNWYALYTNGIEYTLSRTSEWNQAAVDATYSTNWISTNVFATGGGDVYAASNNVFTGTTNTFNNTVILKSSSLSVACTSGVSPDISGVYEPTTNIIGGKITYVCHENAWGLVFTNSVAWLFVNDSTSNAFQRAAFETNPIGSYMGIYGAVGNILPTYAADGLLYSPSSYLHKASIDILDVTTFRIQGESVLTNETDPVFSVWATNSAAGSTNAILSDGTQVNIATLLGGGGCDTNEVINIATGLAAEAAAALYLTTNITEVVTFVQNPEMNLINPNPANGGGYVCLEESSLQDTTETESILWDSRQLVQWDGAWVVALDWSDPACVRVGTNLNLDGNSITNGSGAFTGSLTLDGASVSLSEITPTLIGRITINQTNASASTEYLAKIGTVVTDTGSIWDNVNYVGTFGRTGTWIIVANGRVHNMDVDKAAIIYTKVVEHSGTSTSTLLSASMMGGATYGEYSSINVPMFYRCTNASDQFFFTFWDNNVDRDVYWTSGAYSLFGATWEGP